MKAPRAFSPWRIGAVLAGTLAVTAAVAVLFVFDPATAGFYPVCTLHEMTGLQCPGCGGLRALHQLSHGHLAAAWGLNPFVVALLPAGLWLAVREVARVVAGRQWPGIVTRPLFGWLLAGALVLFGVLRNLPFHAGR
jgi:Protein of unknown function (DUF2752)